MPRPKLQRMPIRGMAAHPLVLAVMENTRAYHNYVSTGLKERPAEPRSGLREQVAQLLDELRQSDARRYACFWYHDGTFRYTANIINAIERMDLTPIFLKRFPRSETYDRHGLTLHRWVQYHYCNYLVAVTGVYDTALLLVNAVFALGLEPRDCRDRTVTFSERVKNTLVEQALVDLDGVISPYRDPRNHFAHRNRLPDLGLLDDLERSMFIESLGGSPGSEADPLGHPVVVQMLYQSERRNLARTVADETDRVASGVSRLFTALEPFYAVFAERLGGI